MGDLNVEENFFKPVHLGESFYSIIFLPSYFYSGLLKQQNLKESAHLNLHILQFKGSKIGFRWQSLHCKNETLLFKKKLYISNKYSNRQCKET